MEDKPRINSPIGEVPDYGGWLVTCAVTGLRLCADSDSSVAARLSGSGQGNCSLAIFGNVEVGTHTEIQNWVPSSRLCELLYFVAVAKTAEVCAGQECMDWN